VVRLTLSYGFLIIMIFRKGYYEIDSSILGATESLLKGCSNAQALIGMEFYPSDDVVNSLEPRAYDRHQDTRHTLWRGIAFSLGSLWTNCNSSLESSSS